VLLLVCTYVCVCGLCCRMVCELDGVYGGDEVGAGGGGVFGFGVETRPGGVLVEVCIVCVCVCVCVSSCPLHVLLLLFPVVVTVVVVIFGTDVVVLVVCVVGCVCNRPEGEAPVALKLTEEQVEERLVGRVEPPYLLHNRVETGETAPDVGSQEKGARACVCVCAVGCVVVCICGAYGCDWVWPDACFL